MDTGKQGKQSACAHRAYELGPEGSWTIKEAIRVRAAMCLIEDYDDHYSHLSVVCHQY